MFRGERLGPPNPCDVSRWLGVATVTQALGTTPNSGPKQHNIFLAAAAFSGRPVSPGGLFSFWGWMGAPTPSRGFQYGRALRDGRLVLETGGGLCQLAGALYFAGLQAGLKPVERHAHSVDLYTDDTRYAPLGSDATVSFGFKDLRLCNPHLCPVAFAVAIVDGSLNVRVVAPDPIMPKALAFRRTEMPDGSVVVETWTEGRKIACSRYERLLAPPT